MEGRNKAYRVHPEGHRSKMNQGAGEACSNQEHLVHVTKELV